MNYYDSEFRGFFNVSPKCSILSADKSLYYYTETKFLCIAMDNVCEIIAIHSMIVVIFGVGSSYTL